MRITQDKFIFHSEYQTTGDQPEVIEALVKGFKEGNQSRPCWVALMASKNRVDGVVQMILIRNERTEIF